MREALIVAGYVVFLLAIMVVIWGGTMLGI